jgi:hypothetical protein
MSGLYAEEVQGLQLVDVNITFVADHAQSYWGTECVNTTAAGFPVSVVGGSCVPPPPHPSMHVVAPLATPPDFIYASDLSYLPLEDCYGSCSHFRASRSAPPEDALAISAAAGLNAVRLRLWVDPSPVTPQGWPGPDYTYANLSSVLGMARRAAKAGLGVWLDFHFSDVWAGEVTERQLNFAISFQTLPHRRSVCRSRSSIQACCVGALVRVGSC